MKDSLFATPALFRVIAESGIEGKQIPEAALVCNLPDDPGLCDFDDVNTFFHEFGHLLHNMFAGHGRWVGIAGISPGEEPSAKQLLAISRYVTTNHVSTIFFESLKVPALMR